MKPDLRQAIKRAFDQASRTYDSAAVLQSAVRQQCLERLELIKLDPRRILDVGAGTGHSSIALARRFKGARVAALDLSTGMLAEASKRRSLFTKIELICGDAGGLPIQSQSVDIIFCNLVLQWCADLDLVFREFNRVLRPQGLLTFSTFGPDTLWELRQAFSHVDDHQHVNRFADMHDVGDILISAGLVEPVMDADVFTLTYDDVMGLMKDLKAIGANTVTEGRRPGLMSKSGLASLRDAYDKFRVDGRLPATYEVVFGHAWAPRAGQGVAMRHGEARIPLETIPRR
jgi:malonyl-CoA O-methyltransferase